MFRSRLALNVGFYQISLSKHSSETNCMFRSRLALNVGFYQISLSKHSSETN